MFFSHILLFFDSENILISVTLFLHSAFSFNDAHWVLSLFARNRALNIEDTTMNRIWFLPSGTFEWMKKTDMNISYPFMNLHKCHIIVDFGQPFINQSRIALAKILICNWKISEKSQKSRLNSSRKIVQKLEDRWQRREEKWSADKEWWYSDQKLMFDSEDAM